MHFKNVQEFLSHAQAEINANRLKLPTLPDIAIKVRDLVANGDATSQQLADYIATDPVVSARLIQVANSPLYRSAQEIKSVTAAVTRLGNSATRTLVTSLTMQQMFSPKSELLADYFRQVWEQSVDVAAICRSLCYLTPHLDREETMLAGLIHQIGKLPILTLIESMPDFNENPERIEKLLAVAHPHMGKIIMDSWTFPNELKPVTSEYTNFSRDAGPKADYVDIVQVGFLQSCLNSHYPAAKIDWATVPAFQKLGLNHNIEILEIVGVADEIELTLATFF